MFSVDKSVFMSYNLHICVILGALFVRVLLDYQTIDTRDFLQCILAAADDPNSW